MDEIRLIRSQLVTEHERAVSIVQACARLLSRSEAGLPSGGAATDPFRRACLEYLRCVLSSFEGRDARLRELAARLPAGDPARETIERALSGSGGREAVGKLESALGASASARSPAPPTAWQEFAAWFDTVWRPRRAAVEALLAPNPRVADWRAVGAIDADSIMEERALYERVRAQLSAGREP